MTKDEAHKVGEYIAMPEPLKIFHKHEWFRTGEMKVGQMRCISCGTWGQEEMPQRTWVGLTADEMEGLYQLATYMGDTDYIHMLIMAEAKLKEKNNV